MENSLIHGRCLAPLRPAARTAATCATALIVSLFLAGRVGAQQAEAPPGPLSKAHAALAARPDGCQQCHVSPGKTDAARCLKCHQPIAARMTAKKGVHREVTGDCAMCHQEHQGADVDLRPLDPASFDHLQETGFALTGGHARVPATCATCHTTRSFLSNTPECSSCHAEPHNGALGTRCSTCHSPASGWKNASRAFHKVDLFPLQGRHLGVACTSCHLNGVTKGTPTRCYDCHWVRRQDDRYRTRLGNQCENCHTPTSWTMVRWSHASATGVALNAQHTTIGCDSCHKDQAFKAGQVVCATCHQADFQKTASPNHAAAGFPTTCDVCHRPSDMSFRGVRFSHNAAYTLVGVHITQPCAACHKNNVYRGTPRDCVGCHLANYQQTRNPSHAGAGFPTTCETCHQPSDASWTQGRFAHTAFPIASGRHAGNACSACHTDPANYKVFSCTVCHDRAQTDSKHQGRAGYRYDSNACYACHPQGRG